MNDACQTSRCAQSKWKRKDSERNGSSVPHILVCLFLALWKLRNLSHLRARRRTHEREASVNKKDPSPNLDSPQTGTRGSSGPWTSSGRGEWLQNNRLLLSDGARRGLSAELKLYGGVCVYVSVSVSVAWVKTQVPQPHGVFCPERDRCSELKVISWSEAPWWPPTKCTSLWPHAFQRAAIDYRIHVETILRINMRKKIRAT